MPTNLTMTLLLTAPWIVVLLVVARRYAVRSPRLWNYAPLAEGPSLSVVIPVRPGTASRRLGYRMAPMTNFRIVIPASLLAAPALLGAQARFASLGPLYVQPVGGLSHYVSPGWGASGAVTWLRHTGPLGLRLEVSYVSFPFGPADHADLRTTAQVPVLVSTGGSRLALSAGPVLGFPLGPVRASLNAGVGATGAFTTMSLTGLGSDDRYNRPKRFSDLAPVFQVGVGAGVRIARGVQLELAAAFGAVGPTSYGLGDLIRVGVISGPYWGPRRQWSEFASYRLEVVFGQRG